MRADNGRHAWYHHAEPDSLRSSKTGRLSYPRSITMWVDRLFLAKELRGMSLNFEELDYRLTPIGGLILRRRRDLSSGVDIFEIKLGDEFLMSSLFTASEIALARLGLAELSEPNLDVVVGGLGLGYTAQAVLEHRSVKSLVIVEALEAVIDWHENGMLPLGQALMA